MNYSVTLLISLFVCSMFVFGLASGQVGIYTNSVVSENELLNANANIENSIVVSGGSIRQNAVVTFSNGQNSTVHFMPAEASEKAIIALKINNCNEENNCTIVLRERKSNSQSEAVYHIEANEKVKVLGFIKTNMKVSAEVNAGTGVVEKVSRPWWSFMASSDTSSSVN